MDQNENIVSEQTENMLHHQFKLLSAQIFFSMKTDDSGLLLANDDNGVFKFMSCSPTEFKF